MSDEYYRDVDQVSAHPSMLEQFMEKKGMVVGEQLKAYNDDRPLFMATYKLRDKHDFMVMLNDETLKNDLFKETHDMIYKSLLPIITNKLKSLYKFVCGSEMRQGTEWVQ